MGKTGKLYSSTAVCSPTSFTQDTSNSFVVHGSGLSVDVAAAAVQRLSSNGRSSNESGTSLDVLLPVTVESISPPSKMKLLVENHSSRTRLCNYKCDSLILECFQPMDAIFDMTTGMEIQQPALFNVFVELPNGNDGFEEKKSIY